MAYRPSGTLTGAALVLALALPAIGRADGQGQPNVLTDAVVQFAKLVSPTPPPNSLAGAVTHFLNPDDVTISKGGTVTFVVNNGGHGVAIYPVDKKTTRDDIAEDLCQGPPGTVESDREARFTVCQTAQANMAYDTTDGKGHLIIETPENVSNSSPRVDDPSNRLLATSGAVRACAAGESEPLCDSSVLGTNLAGGFLVGNVLPIPPNVPTTIGNRIVYQFNEVGRYLVICMNRSHYLNDHMFGFVNVVGGPR